MTRPRPHVGWYVGTGAGARARLRAVLSHLDGARVTVLTDGPSPDLDDLAVARIELPWSAPGGGWSEPADTDVDAAVDRRLRSWSAADRPGLLVVDAQPGASALAARLGIAVVALRRPGAATSHTRGSVAELAPYPAELEPPTTPGQLRDRTVHTGLLSRFAGRHPDRLAGRRRLAIGEDDRVVTVLCGGDGLAGPGALASAARATPSWTWLTVGRCGTPLEGLPANVRRLGWSDDPWPALEAADVVVGGGSLAVIAEVATSRRPFVLVPRPARLADDVVARTLGTGGLATVLSSWPAPSAWSGVLAVALQHGPGRLARLEDARGPALAAERLLSWARPTHRWLPVGVAHAVQRTAPRHRRVIDVTDARRPVAGREA